MQNDSIIIEGKWQYLTIPHKSSQPNTAIALLRTYPEGTPPTTQNTLCKLFTAALFTIRSHRKPPKHSALETVWISGTYTQWSTANPKGGWEGSAGADMESLPDNEWRAEYKIYINMCDQN